MGSLPESPDIATRRSNQPTILPRASRQQHANERLLRFSHHHIIPASYCLQWTNATYKQRGRSSDFDCHWRRVSIQLNYHNREPSLHVVDYSFAEGSAQIANHEYDSKPSIHIPASRPYGLTHSIRDYTQHAMDPISWVRGATQPARSQEAFPLVVALTDGIPGERLLGPSGEAFRKYTHYLVLIRFACWLDRFEARLASCRHLSSTNRGEKRQRCSSRHLNHSGRNLELFDSILPNGRAKLLVSTIDPVQEAISFHKAALRNFSVQSVLQRVRDSLSPSGRPSRSSGPA